MFLITPEFTVRIDKVHKIFPHNNSKRGTYVDVLNQFDEIDREFTGLSYDEVVCLLKGVQRHGI